MDDYENVHDRASDDANDCVSGGQASYAYAGSSCHSYLNGFDRASDRANVSGHANARGHVQHANGRTPVLRH